MPAMLKATSGRPAVPSDYADNPGPNKFFGLDGAGNFGWFTAGGGLPAPAVSNQVFVATWGNDTTGNGSQATPYKTIAKAYSTILDAAANKVYAIIVLQGDYIENVAVKPFILLMGVQKDVVDVHGNFTLDASFVDPAIGKQAWLSSMVIDGLVTLDFVAAGSSDGQVKLNDAIILGDVSVTMGSLNESDFTSCLLRGNYTQLGGFVQWFNTNGNSGPSVLTLTGPAELDASGGSWGGSASLDQNAQAAAVILSCNSFTINKGNINIIDNATHSPHIVSGLGDTPDNCNIGVAGAGELSANMQISHQFANIAPNPTAIGATGTTTISLAVPANLIGATNIETMQCSCSPVGANWGTFIGPHNVSLTFTYRMNGAVPTVDVNIYNPGVGFNITDAINLNFSAYLPVVL